MLFLDRKEKNDVIWRDIGLQLLASRAGDRACVCVRKRARSCGRVAAIMRARKKGRGGERGCRVLSLQPGAAAHMP